MTELQWLSSADPQAMLASIQGKASDRKLRLFACSCCRAVWDGVACGECLGTGDVQGWERRSDIFQRPKCKPCHGTGRIGGLTDPRSRRAVEVAEWYADGEATEEERKVAWNSASDAGEDFDRVYEVGNFNLAIMAQACVRKNIEGVLRANRSRVLPATQAALLREILGNPFRPVHLCPLCKDRPDCIHRKQLLSWNDRTVPRLARRIYDERAFDRMPILADALEDVGCHDVDILAHCRGLERCPVVPVYIPDNGHTCFCECEGKNWIPLRGPHVRGCHVLDTILGKE